MTDIIDSRRWATSAHHTCYFDRARPCRACEALGEEAAKQRLRKTQGEAFVRGEINAGRMPEAALAKLHEMGLLEIMGTAIEHGRRQERACHEEGEAASFPARDRMEMLEL